MDLSEINWDFNAAGAWPIQIKAAFVLLVSCLVAGAGVYAFSIDQFAELETLEREEKELLVNFGDKQKKAVNLLDYRAQLDQIQTLLDDMMKQMPTKAEVADLLTQISQTAVASSLESKLFQPEAEIRKENFYIELPYSIEMIGKYEDLGLFVSGVASMSRIVTIHDVNISPVSKDNKGDKVEDNRLAMTAIIKTYNDATDEQMDDSDKKTSKKGADKNKKGADKK
jgi:type IV pilus assembly protein PilO